MLIAPSDGIQITIAVIMLISTILSGFFSYWVIRTNNLLNKTQFFSQTCKEERDLRKQIEEYDIQISKARKKYEKTDLRISADELLFDFYEYISILFFRKKIDDDMFYDYFSNLIIDPYLCFMESDMFENHKDRYESYPNLSQLFNKVFKLSIKEIPTELKADY